MADHGKKPLVIDIEEATLTNDMFRDTIWTGERLQLTLMSLKPGEDIGLEAHHGIDQFIRIEQGTGRCQMGPKEDELTFVKDLKDDDIILVPADMWHNITNTGDIEMKLYTLYGPADHLPGTQHPTKEDAENDPNEH